MIAINQACRGKRWLTQSEKETPAKSCLALSSIHFYPLPDNTPQAASQILRQGGRTWPGWLHCPGCCLLPTFLALGQGSKMEGSHPSTRTRGVSSGEPGEKASEPGALQQLWHMLFI